MIEKLRQAEAINFQPLFFRIAFGEQGEFVPGSKFRHCFFYSWQQLDGLLENCMRELGDSREIGICYFTLAQPFEAGFQIACEVPRAIPVNLSVRYFNLI